MAPFARLGYENRLSYLCLYRFRVFGLFTEVAYLHEATKLFPIYGNFFIKMQIGCQVLFLALSGGVFSILANSNCTIRKGGNFQYGFFMCR